MKCKKCVWGRIVFSAESELGLKTTIMCSRIKCSDMPADEEKLDHMIKKPLVYVCSPLRGNIKRNLMQASRYCRFVSQCNAIPIAPHLYFTQFLDDQDCVERRLGMELGLNVLSRCSAIWVFGRDVSTGMITELETAKKLGIPAYYFDSTCTPIEETERE